MLTRRHLLQLLGQGAVVLGVPGGATRLLAAPPCLPRLDPADRLTTWPASLWVEGLRFDRHGPHAPVHQRALTVVYANLFACHNPTCRDRPHGFEVVVTERPEMMVHPDFITDRVAVVRAQLADFLRRPPPHFSG